MKRCMLVVAIVCASLSFPSGEARAGNVEFNFNSKLEGWTFGGDDSPTAPSLYWEWQKQSSNTEGAIHAWLGPNVPLSQAVAWAESPCLEIEQEADKQHQVHVDFSHWTDFPDNVSGQVQFDFKRATDATWFGWQGVPLADWDPTSGHHMPVVPTLPPLDTTAPSFQGISSPFQKHITSAFDIKWADFAPNLQNGDEIRFRFLVGVTAAFPQGVTSIDPRKVWEVNDMTIDGVKVCAVPEPGSLAMTAAAAVSGLVIAGRRRFARGRE